METKKNKKQKLDSTILSSGENGPVEVDIAAVQKESDKDQFTSENLKEHKKVAQETLSSYQKSRLNPDFDASKQEVEYKGLFGWLDKWYDKHFPREKQTKAHSWFLYITSFLTILMGIACITYFFLAVTGKLG